MKATDLIKKLSMMMANHGDMDITVWQSSPNGGFASPVQGIYLERYDENLKMSNDGTVHFELDIGG